MTEPENVRLEVLRALYRYQPIDAKKLAFYVVYERYDLPHWMLTAIHHKWDPPSDWKREERERVKKEIRDLVDEHEIVITAEWLLRRRSDVPPLQIIAEQAT